MARLLAIGSFILYLCTSKNFRQLAGMFQEEKQRFRLRSGSLRAEKQQFRLWSGSLREEK